LTIIKKAIVFAALMLLSLLLVAWIALPRLFSLSMDDELALILCKSIHFDQFRRNVTQMGALNVNWIYSDQNKETMTKFLVALYCLL
jgi:hypothetical protein